MHGRTTRRDGLFLLILAAWSCWYFVRDGATAYEWPAVDIAPLVARNLDPEFLENDFYTDATAKPNPRRPFAVLLTAIAALLGDDWYAALYLTKAIVVVLLPVLWYIVLRDLARWHDDGSHGLQSVLFALVPFVAILLVVRPKITAAASIAWWPPFHPQATAANVSLLFALSGSAIALSGLRRKAIVAGLFWTAATVLHPAISLFALLFHALAKFDEVRTLDAAATFVLCWLVPSALLAWYCVPESSLTTTDFIYDYVIVRHAAHYWPPAFGSLTGTPWWQTFFALTGTMLAVFVYAFLRGDRRLATLALLFAGTYAGCVGLQYVAVIAWPSKLVAALGPVRFTAFGFFQITLLLTLVARDVLTILPRLSHPSRADAWRNWLPRRDVAFGIVAVGGIALGLATRDDPASKITQANPDFYRWIAEHTPQVSVFVAADGELSVNIPLLAHRAVAAGFGFPFREDDFAEQARRHQLFYGSPQERAALAAKREGGSPGDTTANAERDYFRRLEPEDFARIARELRLDYVIIEANHARAFAGTKPVFADERIHVYRP